MIKPDLEIIKSPEAERMRQMVTEGFYDRSRIGLWLFEVIGREYDDMAEWARTLRLECFPQTCTWSIAIWEFVYGYEPDDTLPLAYRRARLLARKLSRPPINPARIEAVLSALTGCPVHITENYAPYTFLVEVDESDTTIYDFREAIRTLRRIKPSHLSYRYESYVTAEYEVTDYIAGAIAELYREYIIGDETEIVTDREDYAAGAAADWTKEYQIGDESPIRTELEDYYAGAEGAVFREFISEGFPIEETAAAFFAGVAFDYVKEAFEESYPISETVASYDSGATSELVKEAYTE